MAWYDIIRLQLKTLSEPVDFDGKLHAQDNLVPIPTWRITVWGTVSLPRWCRTNSRESRYPLRPNSNSSGKLESVKACWLKDSNLYTQQYHFTASFLVNLVSHWSRKSLQENLMRLPKFYFLKVRYYINFSVPISGLLGRQLTGSVSCKPSSRTSRLPLLSARFMVTLPDSEHHRPW